jgi:exodeoxyribonuclease V
LTQWGNQQAAALKAVGDWLKNPGNKQVFRLFGYAGTGKSTMARHLAEGVGQVNFAAFTGKAASIMRAAGCYNAQTIHSLIYKPIGDSGDALKEIQDEIEHIEAQLTDNDLPQNRRDHLLKRMGVLKGSLDKAKKPEFVLRQDSELKNSDLLILDEVSMVDENMAMDLMSFGKPILALGDPAQLPPVMGAGYFTDARPDIMLTEIHRQARDNPIIELATRVREGRSLQHGNFGESRIIRRSEQADILNASQILVGMNATRFSANRYHRRLSGRGDSPFPYAGEKVVCLRNDKETGLLNGTLHITTQDAVPSDDFVLLTMRSEDEVQMSDLSVLAHPEHFNGNPDRISPWERNLAQEFTYGYALTVHKAQGSGWKDVLLVDEWRRADSRQRWLYTGITRAKERITIVRGE